MRVPAEDATAARADPLPGDGGLDGVGEAHLEQPEVRLLGDGRDGGEVRPDLGGRRVDHDPVGDGVLVVVRRKGVEEQDRQRERGEGQVEAVAGEAEQPAPPERAQENKAEQQGRDDDQADHALVHENARRDQAQAAVEQRVQKTFDGGQGPAPSRRTP